MLAAASFTDALPRIAAAWQARGGVPVVFDFEGTPDLVARIEAGEPADLFFSGDGRWMDHLERSGAIVPETRVDLAGNRLVAACPSNSPFTPASPAEIASPEVRFVAVAADDVPSGRYARAALESLGIWPAVEGRLARGGSGRDTLRWVARGEAQVGIALESDAYADRHVRFAFALPESSHPPIRHPAAVLRASTHPQEALRFLEFCRGPEGRAILGAAGFRPVAGQGG
ncbi:molybdate ABC transporter substrate-binding protein [Myxococcota bacterium]|nr:molybdate ABC transporter substrate-binding protein [Myxococcota bacterium]